MQRNNDDLTEGGQLLVHRGCLGMSHTWIQGTGVRVTFFLKKLHIAFVAHYSIKYFCITSLYGLVILNYLVMIKTLSQSPTH